ncbi:hypothetical protein ACF1A9_28005 [Streptomyces sp. NPDC014872]|uniref:hypothetical protein n=1 Tax=Streptomyces sp. NPDC014872 TaxID=3364926 RepID=UPI0036F8CB2B
MNPTTLKINNCRTAVISRTTPLLQRRTPRACPSTRKNSGRYKPKKDSCTGGITHGPDSRIDRAYATPELLPAVDEVDVIEVDADLSDHHILRIRMNAGRLAEILNRAAA